MGRLKLLQETHIVLKVETKVIDAKFQHRNSFDSHPESKPGIFLAEFVLRSAADLFVSAVERHLSGWTTLLRTFQLAMMVLAILSALALMYAGYVFILEPVSRLKSALHDIEDGDFATRVIVETGDEMGSLAEGFNSMAENLQSLYGNLETKVREKTASLETKQQRLSALYEVAAFVASAETLEELAHGFARHMRRIAQADAVAIRWSDVANERYVLLGSDCLPHVMAEEEQCVLSGDCFCGAKVESGTMPSVRVIPILDASRSLSGQAAGRRVHEHCERAGYATLITVPLGLHMRVLGEVELFYRGEPSLSEEEKALFEALASHLAGAMESLRAAALGREAAVFSERQLLAQELHDSIAQSLAFLKIQMQLLRDAMGRQDQAAIHATMDELDVGVREGPFDAYVAQGWRRSDGDRDHADGRTSNVYGRLGYQLTPEWQASVMGLYSNNYAMDPGEVGKPATRQGKYRTRDSLGTLTLAHDYGRVGGEIKVYSNDGRSEWTGQTGTDRDTLMDWEQTGLRARESLQPWEGGRVELGFDSDRVDGDVDFVRQNGTTTHWKASAFRIDSPLAVVSQEWGLGDGWSITPSAGVRYYQIGWRKGDSGSFLPLIGVNH